jgi:hypothetical protein
MANGIEYLYQGGQARILSLIETIDLRYVKEVPFGPRRFGLALVICIPDRRGI